MTANFFGSLLYNLNLRQNEDVQKDVSLITHSTSIFAVIIAYLATIAFVDSGVSANYYQLTAAIFILLALYYYDPKRKSRPER